jgi:2-polyprenyl-3-methyl-5-hydroxy-6-metoxy-1,4-benzoquinol methylase
MKDLEYLINQYKELHKNNIYGMSSIYLITPISELINRIKPKRVLDYGCGQSKLLNVLYENYPDIDFVKYDPAIEKYSKKPTGKFDLIICTDVLEHIPEKYLDYILKDISSLSDNVLFNISTKTAIWHLPDGSNCHKTVKEKDWWIDLLTKYFKDVEVCHNKYFMLGIQTWSK